jgi:dipeptidyl aminopeptidase/acylaminoacyl peptidase
MKHARKWPNLLTGILCASMQASLAAAQSNPPAAPSNTASRYHQPPRYILDVMQAPLPPRPYVSPTNDTVLLVTREYYPSIARVSTPFLRLAGVRIEPKNHSRHDTRGGYGITPCARSIDLVRVADARQTHIALPADSCAGTPAYSADGKQFTFINIAPEAVELWVGDTLTASAHRVPGVRLNPALYDELQWMPDQKTILVKLVPDNLGPPPPDPIVPSGPSILRLLHRLATRTRRSADRQDPNTRQDRQLRIRKGRPRRPPHPDRRAAQTLFLRHDLRALPQAG